jgi:phosphoribosylaminoimidazolecarboxamide formyltransferase/IMP cyclohydrolase
MAVKKTISRALLSVTDKTGIIEFAQSLLTFKVELLSTGGTAALLKQHGLPVTEITDLTGFPEMMDGRVKTLHPKIHGGILARPIIDEAVAKQHDIPLIDLVVVNLYSFEKTTANPECDLRTAIENIDIGGPALLRAAAKNYQRVTAIIDSQDYSRILAEMQANHAMTTLETRFELAKKAFAYTARYDAIISNYLAKRTSLHGDITAFPDVYTVQYHKKMDLRYGENPHQRAAFYQDTLLQPQQGSITSAVQQQGKPLSFNNIADADAALQCVSQFKEPTCVIVKHANPCGVASSSIQLLAYQQAFATDPTSAFGGIIAFNTPLERTTATTIIHQQFAEVIIAPEIDPEASQILTTKPNIRVLACGHLQALPASYYDYKRVQGGLLIQDSDTVTLDLTSLKAVTRRKPNTQEMQDLAFAWYVVQFVKSNAIVYAKNSQTLGIGAGQMSRIFSTKIATLRAEEAGLSLKAAVIASDAFFPFRDAIDYAGQLGITAIIQPGGSIRDEEVIQTADEYDMAMFFTHVRHFRH